jgi:5'-nucleotidase
MERAAVQPTCKRGTTLSDESQPLILITNDDGIASPGLMAAVRAVLDLGEIWVAAPRMQQSGLGRSFPGGTIKVRESILDVDGARVRCIALDASPAQAVRHGILRFLPRVPDLAISGINYGENLGGSVTISGTVGAAIEAAGFGVPTLAASLETDKKHHFSLSNDVDFSAAALFVRRFAEWLLRHGMPEGVDVLKLEVPSDATPNTVWRVTRVSRQPYWVSPVSIDEHGDRHISGYIKEIDFDTLESDSDVQAVAVDRVVSVSPLTIDLTATVGLEGLQTRLSRSVSGAFEPK